MVVRARIPYIRAMFDRLFGARGKKTASNFPRVAAGSRVYAVGDIHGRLDLLREIDTRIQDDAARAPVARNTVIYLGDYIEATCRSVRPGSPMAGRRPCSPMASIRRRPTGS